MVPFQYIVPVADIDSALAVGVHWVQLAAQSSPRAEHCATLLQRVHEAGSYLVLTDDVACCKTAAADGVVLTPSGIAHITATIPEPTGIVLQRPRPVTLAIGEARRTLGEESPQFVGIVVETPEDAVAAAKAGADFIQAPWSLCLPLLQAVRERSFTTPVVALGVNDAETVVDLLNAGISGVACLMQEVPPVMVPLFLNADEQ